MSRGEPFNPMGEFQSQEERHRAIRSEAEQAISAKAGELAVFVDELWSDIDDRSPAPDTQVADLQYRKGLLRQGHTTYLNQQDAWILSSASHTDITEGSFGMASQSHETTHRVLLERGGRLIYSLGNVSVHTRSDIIDLTRYPYSRFFTETYAPFSRTDAVHNVWMRNGDNVFRYAFNDQRLIMGALTKIHHDAWRARQRILG